MEDELSGPLTLAFDMLTLDKDHLEGAFDCRACLCATEENSLNVIRARMAEEDLTGRPYDSASPCRRKLPFCKDTFKGL